MAFTARYEGMCDECGSPIDEGDQVTYVDDVLVHEECADDARSAGLTILTDPFDARRKPDKAHPGNPAKTFL